MKIHLGNFKNSLTYLLEINVQMDLLKQGNISNEECMKSLMEIHSKWNSVAKPEVTRKLINELMGKVYVEIYDKNREQLYIGCKLKSPHLFNEETYDIFELVKLPKLGLCYKNLNEPEGQNIYDLDFLGHSDLALIH